MFQGAPQMGSNNEYPANINRLGVTMTRQTSPSDQVNVEAGKVDAFGERISIAIQRVGGATRMAEMASVSTSVLRKWRAGQSEPQLTSLVSMARAAGVTVEWLATGEGSPDKGAESPSKQGFGPAEIDLDLLESVATTALEELEARRIRLEPAAQARLLRVLYRHFASRGEQPDLGTVSNIIDLAAYR